MRTKVTLSIVLPCHNEQEVIVDTVNTLTTLLLKWESTLISDYEIVMVNNGSTDNTLTKMRELQSKDDRLVVVDLRRNYGYQGSISAGLFTAKNDVVVTIDADLQDDPNKIGEMLQKYYEGYDLVLGVRARRKTDSFLKRTTANLYYWLQRKLGVESVPNHGDFRLLSRELVEELKRFPERNRYLRGMILQLESKYGIVYYERRKRKAGKSKFGIGPLFSLAFDGITSFTNVPLRFILLFGFLMFLLSILGIAFISYVRFGLNIDVPGWAFISLAIMIFGGIQSLFLGILGEYIAKSYFEVKQRPIYLVRKIYKKDTFDTNLSFKHNKK